MLHFHGTSCNHHSNEKSSTNIKIAFLLNFSFAIIEVIGGILTNSVAILSDALHDLGDSLSLGFAWYLNKISAKKRDKFYSYGYKRFSLLGAIICSIVLLVGSSFFIKEAILRIIYPEEVEVSGMILLAFLGIFVNGLAVFKLKHGETLNEKVVSLHLIEDLLGWIIVLIGAIIMYFFNFPIIDPILSIIISIFILYKTIISLKKIMKIILQAYPENINIQSIKKKIASIKEVISTHDLHAWTIDGNYNILTIHIVIDEANTLNNITNVKKKIRETLKSENIHHITIEIESQNEICELKTC